MELTIEQTLQQGVAAHNAGNLQEAERAYRAILQSQLKHPDANHNLGLIAISVNQIEAALPLFKTALDVNPNVEQFWMSYIDALFKNNQVKDAKQAIKKAKKKGFNATKLQASFSQSKVNADTKVPSQQQLSCLLEYFQTGQYGDAEKLAKSVAHQFPQHQFAWKVLGAIFGQSGRTVEAENANQISVALSPQDAEAYNNLGNTLEELGRLDEALASFTRAIALKPDYAEAHSNLGITLQELGRLGEAEPSHTQAIAVKPNFPEAHYNLGITLQELGRLGEAEASYMHAIALKPDYAGAHSNLGNTLRELGRIDEALASYTQAIALKPDLAEAHYNQGIAQQKLGRLGEAEASYNQAMALKPDFPEACYNLGVTLKELGRLNEAKASYAKSIALKPDYAEAKHMLAALSGETTATAPRAYVEGLFDNYAANFESSLVDKLEYKIPKVLAEMIVKDSKFDLLGSVLDLGCGTGLFGVEIKKFCERLEGIDLSGKMLDEAKEKNVYNKLIKEDILAYLSNASLNFDYFVSTDVFIYIGDLSDTFRFIKSRNKKSGKFAFSTEIYDGEDFFLEQSGRYSHSKKYIEGLCKKFGYELSHFEIQALRKDKNQFIRGGLYVLDF